MGLDGEGRFRGDNSCKVYQSSYRTAPADRAWSVLVDTSGWRTWGRFATGAIGRFEPGCRWEVELEGERTMRPVFLSMEPGRRLLFETRFAGGWLGRIEHAFVIGSTGPDTSELRQVFEATGPLSVLAWPLLYGGMVQFDALGDDLARTLAGDRYRTSSS
ncbi:MAG: hypothetical protein GY913_14165 [Proteobacteria bacterium]|nr:hypothetical protein [Pseudomonadota bacterium]MCP4918054.1 hypothetical protein [Pseudomonadota bacterium]